MPSRAFLLLFGLLIAGWLHGLSLLAQSPEQPVPGYVAKRWTTADGLPNNVVNTLAQTRDGYLWIGTGNAGLVRFDGVTFRTFDMLNTPGFPGNTVWALHEDAQGTLWIGTASGLARYQDGTVAPQVLDGKALHGIVDLAEGPDGRLWVATTGLVARHDGDQWTTIHVVETQDVTRILAGRDGTLWIATRSGLVAWRDGVVRTLTARDGLPGGSPRALLEDDEGRLWVGTTVGLAHFSPNAEAARVERSLLADVPVTALFADRRGTLWIGSISRLFARAPDGSLTESRVDDAPDPGHVERFMEDREGHLWFGVSFGRGGLYRLSRERVTTMAHEQGLPCDNVGPITQGADGTVWLATLCRDGRGVVAVRDGRITWYPGPRDVESILAEPDGEVWTGAFGGEMFRFVPSPRRPFDPVQGRFIRYPSPTLDAQASIAAMYRHTDGSLWLATDKGLFRQHNGAWSRIGAGDGLVSDNVRIISPGENGSVWIGGEAGVSHYEGGRFTNYTAEHGVPPGPVRAIHVDAEGVVWMGSYGGGLARLKHGRVTAYGLQGGVLDSSVHRIVEDEAGFLWMSGDRGIRRVSKRELNAIAEGRSAVPAVVLYGEADGLKSVEANGMAQPAGWRMRDGTLQFPTQAGAVTIDPRRTGEDAPPAPLPHIDGATVDGRAYGPAGTLTVPAGYRELELEYTAPAFARPEQVQFRYRLDGYDNDWVEASTRRLAHYANLAPGEYRFRVTARHSGGPWQEQAATMALVLEPWWYQRLPFQIGLAALALTATVALVRWRLMRLGRRAHELEATVSERTAEVANQRDAVREAHDRLAIAHNELAAAKYQVEQAHGQVLAVLGQLDIAVLVLNRAGIVRYASESAQRLLDKEASALVGRSWASCLPLVESDHALVKARVEAPTSIAARMPVQMVLNGKRFWTEIDVRDEPQPGSGRILYIYNVTEVSLLSPKGARIDGPHGIVGRSTAMHLVYRQIRDVARVDATVLIEGETGTGKELVARAIHRGSQRAERPFVAVNAAGLAESLLASQLFGHRRGAFTGAVADQMGVFEAANGGTLFLDEIGDIPSNMQVSLLRVLQEREITRIGESHARQLDVRFLAATHRDLTREVTDGRFREDLLYRIRVATIRLPALRDRLDDIPLLVDAFLSQGARLAGRSVPEMSREAMAALMRHPWPGNVRQLKGAIEQALLRSPGAIIRLEDLPEDIGVEAANGPTGANERERLLDALRRAEGNRSEAARILGIGRSTLYRKLAAHGLDTEN